MSFCTPPRRRRARPGLVALEDRTLLAAGSGAFAYFSGTLTGAHAQATIPMTINRADFTLASGHVLLGLDMQTHDRLRIVPDGRASVRTLANEDGAGYSLVELGAGTYTLRVRATGRAGEAYRIAVSLAGDTRGAFQVDSQDLATIRALKGQRRGEPGYLAAADVNHDGVINTRDVRLAGLNAGAATSIRPLAVTLGLGPSTPATASGAVYQPSVTVAGQTAPGATLSLYGAGAGSASMTLSNDPSLVAAASKLTTTADALGRYQFTFSAAVGANALRVVASDGFRQQSSATLTVTRVVDTKPPTIVIQTPSAGVTVNNNIGVSGHVADDLTGVATLQEQFDSGPLRTVAVDASGNFTFTTTLPLDGTADGPHTVVLRATDGAGNVAQASTTFTLTTTLVNRALTTDPGVQQMPSIATDPEDPTHLVLAYMDYSLLKTGYAGIGVAVSHDSGANWQYTSVPLPAGFDQGAASPIAKFDGQGHVFVCFNAATFLGPLAPLTNANAPDRGLPGIQSNSGVFVSRSDDGGLAWNQPVAVMADRYTGQPVDFESAADLAIDTFRTLLDGSPNPHYGELYVTWEHVYAPGHFPGEPDSTGGDDIMFSVSKDGGQTWQLQLQTLPGSGLVVSSIHDPVTEYGLGIPLGQGYLSQAHVTIGPEGDIYVSDAGGGDFVVQHSTDDGRSFSIANHDTGQGIAFGTGFATYVDSNGPPTNPFRTNTVRVIAADPTRPGTIYAVEADQVLDASGNVRDYADVVFARSSDHGQTWQTSFMVGPYPATALNDDNHGQPATGSPDDVITSQALPRLAVDAQGNIAVIWYDTRRDPANHLLDVFGTVSTDGGHTFSPNFRITDQSFDANSGKFTDATGQTNYYLGDSLGLSLANNTAYASWTDTRNGNQDVYFTHFPITPAPAPPNDRFEPNNTPATATDLGTITSDHLTKLALPAGDNDWFRVTAFSTGSLTVTATPSDPGLGLHIELWDASGTMLLATESAMTGQEGQKVVFAGQSGKSYLVHVTSEPGTMASAAVSPQYSLDITSLTADLGNLVYQVQDGSLQPGDRDYDHLVAGASGSLVVMLTPGVRFSGGVNLQVLDPAKRTVLATGSVGPDGIVTASLAVQQGQALLVGISGGATTSEDYRLELINLDQFATPNSPSLVFPSGAGPSSVAVGDLNGDGKPDLIVSDGLSNTLSVLLGNGDGTFQAPRQYAIGAFKSPSPVSGNFGLPNYHRQVVIADFNRDGIPDLAVTNYDSGTVSVLLGRGDGTFAPQVQYDATTAPWGLTVGDFNGDGIPDLAVIDSQAIADSTVAILLGRGDGTFLPEKTFPALTGGGYGYSNVAAADLNRDGKDDLVVSGSNNFERISVFLSNGDGTFQHKGDFAGGVLGGGAAVADVNGDGIPDVVTTSYGPLNSVVVDLGSGDGTFGSPMVFPAGEQPVAVAVADLGSQVTLPDGSTVLGPPDGHSDLIVADGGHYTGGGYDSGLSGVYLLPGLVDAQGKFAGFGAPILLAPGQTPQSLALGDFTGNGATDVAFVDVDGVHIIYQKPPVIPPNDTPQTARNLGTVVHVVEPAQTIIPGHSDAYYTLAVPTETADGAGAEVIDFSGDFQATNGAGLAMEVRDAAGNLLGSGARFQVTAPQGAVLTLHVFAATATNGTRGAGAYTLDIDVLPQVVSVEAQTLLPGQGGVPGGPTASLVVTLQGDRLDPATAENPANYTVTWLGPDGKAGTADDQVIPVATGFQSVVYDPSANIDVASGKSHPTAVRQTVTLLFSQPLPAGSYQVTLSPAIQAAPFTAGETSLLSGGTALAGHPVVSLPNGQVTSGSVVTATDLVLQSGALGNLNTLKAGNAFLTQLHDDLSALLDTQKTAQGGQAQITPALIDQVLNRLEQGLGAPGHRTTTAVALLFDPVSIGVDDPAGDSVDYDLGSDDLTDTTMDSFVDVDSNIEIVILFDPLMDVGASGNMDVTVDVSDVPPDASGAAVVLGDNGDDTMDLTPDLDAGMTNFDIPADPTEG